MRDTTEFDILILAGLYNSGPDHWQSHWEAAFPNMRRVQQDDWDKPVYADWAGRLSEAVDRCTKPVLLIAHSLGNRHALGAHREYRSDSWRLPGGPRIDH